jgi:hypothetical protein
VSPVRKTARAKAKRSLAYLWRVKVREKRGGRCAMTAHYGWSHLCEGAIQAAHAFGVDEAPAVRLALWNGEPLCASSHEYFERHKARWRDFLCKFWGPALYAERLALARSTVKVDLAAAAAELGAA